MATEFNILGPLEIYHDGARLELAGTRRRALVAALLLRHNETVSSEALIDALWDGDPGATNALQANVSRVRRDLGPLADRLQTHPAGYRLEVRPGELDAERFERALDQDDVDAALALWRGPVLGELGLEAFAVNEVRRLEELRLGAIEGRGTSSIADLEALVAEHPLRERLRGQLMLALSNAGRHADALAVYRQGREKLDELGMQPGPELRELEQAILTHARPRGTAPAPPTPTIGREQDLEQIEQHLKQTRLLTLIGPGGVGKTRLAIEVARRLDAPFVSLASVTSAAQVAPAIADVLKITRVPGEDAEDAIARALTGTVVLDNLEQAAGAGAVIARLLERADIRLLATSRQPLDVLAEQRYPVAPLQEDAAVQLFETRARARAANVDDREAVAGICRRLGGLPLAIELAVGRLGLLDAHGLVERLDDALALLGSGAADLPARQRTLRATLDWSYELLTPDEQQAFAALGATAGGCELEAALATTAAHETVLEALVDKSLVTAFNGRLYLLEPVHQYAAERTDDSAKERHHAHYLALAERTRRELWARGESMPGFATLQRERDNFRAALRWAVDARRGDEALQLAGALDPYWNVTHAEEEGRGWCLGALAVADDEAPPADRARAHLGYANLIREGTIEDATEHAEIALGLYRSIGDHEGMAHALVRMTNLHFLNADPDRAQKTAEQALEHAREAGDEALLGFALGRLALGRADPAEARAHLDEGVRIMRVAGASPRAAICVSGVAFQALQREDYDVAIELMHDAMPDARASGNTYLTMMLEGNLGLAALLTGATQQARAAFRKELEWGRQEGLTVFVFEGLLGLGALAGDDHTAATLHGAAHAHLDTPIRAVEEPVYDRIQARFYAPARERLGEAAWQNAAATGRALTADKAIELAVSAR